MLLSWFRGMVCKSPVYFRMLGWSDAFHLSLWHRALLQVFCGKGLRLSHLCHFFPQCQNLSCLPDRLKKNLLSVFVHVWCLWPDFWYLKKSSGFLWKLQICYSVCLSAYLPLSLIYFFFLLFLGAEAWTQGLVHSKHRINLWAALPSLLFKPYFLWLLTLTV